MWLDHFFLAWASMPDSTKPWVWNTKTFGTRNGSVTAVLFIFSDFGWVEIISQNPLLFWYFCKLTSSSISLSCGQLALRASRTHGLRVHQLCQQQPGNRCFAKLRGSELKEGDHFEQNPSQWFFHTCWETCWFSRNVEVPKSAIVSMSTVPCHTLWCTFRISTTWSTQWVQAKRSMWPLPTTWALRTIPENSSLPDLLKNH